MLRYLPTPEWERCFEEDITGTAIAHIDHGLFEAHARDEAGFGELAGHNRMWFVARDIAFEHPPTEDLTARMLGRMGLDPAPKTAAQLAEIHRNALKERVLPDDLDFDLAETVLGDTELLAGDGEPARLISHIRNDETPHVSWLRTALSEMRDRTWVGEGGHTHAGDEMIERIWGQALSDSIVLRRRQNLHFFMAVLEHTLDGRPDRDDVIDEMLSMGSVVRLEDGTVADPDQGLLPA
jgi:hypothetical protein